MTEREVVICNRRGVHVRVASELAKLASGYGRIYLVHRDAAIDCSSALEVLGLGLEYGTRVLVRTDGERQGEAMRAVEDLFNNSVNP